jgi:hypothetical protein
MDRTWARIRYRTTSVENLTEGWVALELVRDTESKTETAARVTYWDAVGQFSFQMFGGEIPLTILEEFVAEAKAAVRTS